MVRRRARGRDQSPRCSTTTTEAFQKHAPYGNSPLRILDPAASCPACSIVSFSKGTEKPILPRLCADVNAKAVRTTVANKNVQFQVCSQTVESEFVAPFRLLRDRVNMVVDYDTMCKTPRNGTCSTRNIFTERLDARTPRCTTPNPICRKTYVIPFIAPAHALFLARVDHRT